MQILQREGIDLDYGAARLKPAVIGCPRCDVVNSRESKFCSKCSYPLIPEAFDEVKAAERKEIEELRQQYTNVSSCRQWLQSWLQLMKQLRRSWHNS
jgi:integrase/recombinase XerD